MPLYRGNGSFFIRRSRIYDTLIPMLKRAWTGKRKKAPEEKRSHKRNS